MKKSFTTERGILLLSVWILDDMAESYPAALSDASLSCFVKTHHITERIIVALMVFEISHLFTLLCLFLIGHDQLASLTQACIPATPLLSSLPFGKRCSLKENHLNVTSQRLVVVYWENSGEL